MTILVVFLIAWIFITQLDYHIRSMGSEYYTSCYRCKNCQQVHENDRTICGVCGHSHTCDSRMYKQVGKWEFTRYPTKILFYKVDKYWKSKTE